MLREVCLKESETWCALKRGKPQDNKTSTQRGALSLRQHNNTSTPLSLLSLSPCLMRWVEERILLSLGTHSSLSLSKSQEMRLYSERSWETCPFRDTSTLQPLNTSTPQHLNSEARRLHTAARYTMIGVDSVCSLVIYRCALGVQCMWWWTSPCRHRRHRWRVDLCLSHVIDDESTCVSLTRPCRHRRVDMDCTCSPHRYRTGYRYRLDTCATRERDTQVDSSSMTSPVKETVFWLQPQVSFAKEPCQRDYITTRERDTSRRLVIDDESSTTWRETPLVALSRVHVSCVSLSRDTRRLVSLSRWHLCLSRWRVKSSTSHESSPSVSRSKTSGVDDVSSRERHTCHGHRVHDSSSTRHRLES